MSFDVYVERTQDPSPEARQRVAAAIAERFGVPKADLLAKLEGGRFRAKAGIDRGKALQFAAELEALGAVCSVVAQAQAAPRPVAPPAAAKTMMGTGLSAALAPPQTPRATPAPMPAIKPAVPPAAAVRAPLATARTMAAPPTASSLMPSPLAAVRESKNYGNSDPGTTGLQAAFNGGTESQEIGALNSLEVGSFSLATLDGEDDSDMLDMPTPHDFLPQKDSTARGGVPASVLNPFAPPSEDEEGPELDLQVVSLPQPKAPTSLLSKSAQATKLAEVAPSTLKVEDVKPTKARPPGVPFDIRVKTVVEKLRAFAERTLSTDRGRFATGIALAVILAFLPMHVVASAWEGVSFSGAQEDLKSEYLGALDQGRDAMIGMKDGKLIDMYGTRRFIVFGSLLMWIGSTAGLFFVWQTRVDTERLRKFLASKKWTPPARPLPPPEPVEPPADAS